MAQRQPDGARRRTAHARLIAAVPPASRGF